MRRRRRRRQRLRYSHDGRYNHPRATPLLKALYGFDPVSLRTYTWQDYDSERARHRRTTGRASM
jgi:hypothetical protein